MIVRRPDNSIERWERVFNDDCIRNETLEAQNVTPLFQKGQNFVTIELHDVCGGAAGTLGPVFLTIH
jgi:hypothetical protein